MKNLNLALSIAAGLFGGILSHYAWTQPVQAQLGPTKEIRAQSFVLVNDKNEVQGTFIFDASEPGGTKIKLLDGNGKEIWTAGGIPAHARPVSVR